jgi:integrase
MEIAVPSGRDIIRLALVNRKVPANAIEVTMASITTSTVKQYSNALRNWWSFCQASEIPMFMPSAAQFLEFLAQEWKKVNSYSSINNIRSAVSLVTENEIGSHPLVKRFCKGAGALKPPRPRYDFIWDPAPVIANLATLYPYDKLPLKTVSKKLVLLLALGTGQRVQTLASLRLSQVSLTDKLVIRFPDRIKTSAPGRPQPFFSFSPFEGNENICIYNIIKHYLQITEGLRDPSCDAFFLSVAWPHRAVGHQTISRWIRLGLAESGIDTNLFSSHSTRHAATSLAKHRGVPLDLIKKAAGWSGPSRTFARFYNRPIVNPEEFSNAILRA